MSLLLLASAAAAPLPTVAQPSRFTPPAAHCPQSTQHYAWQSDRKIGPRKLTELPNANAYLAVYRLVNGCEVPVVVRYGIGTR